MELKQLLRDLCGAYGVAGREEGAAGAARRWLEPIGECRATALGSLLCQVAPAPENGPHLLIDAHLDEIGLIVTHITEEGFIKVAGVGGVDRRPLPAAQATIHGVKPVKGIVCSTPPHLRESAEHKVDKLEAFAVDAGLSAESARELIRPGDRVTLDAGFTELLGDLVAGRALDDRAGCAAVIRAAQLLHDEPPACGVTLSLSVMEETGGSGAATAAYEAAPTHAVAVDVSFARCQGAPGNIVATVGSGAMIGVAPILSREMSDSLRAAAEIHHIPYTVEVMGGATGTNADPIAASRAGVKTALISIPQRNMHSPVEIVSLSDVEAAAQLIAAYARSQF